MALVSARDFQLIPNVTGELTQALQFAGGLQQLQQGAQAGELNEQIRALSGRAATGDPQAMQELTALSPQTAQQVTTAQAGQQKALTQQQQDELRSITQGALQVQSLTTDNQKLDFLRRRRAEIIERGGNTVETDNVINLFETGQTDLANKQIAEAVRVGERLGFIKSERGAGGLASAKTEILESGSVIQALPDGTVQVRDPSGKVVTGQARLDALKQSRQQALKTLQAESDIEVATEGKKSEAKLKTQLALKPQIESAVSEARILAADRGETFTELRQMKAALPSLRATVDTLRDLSSVATSTFGGRVFDTAVKETGFGATKGATARAKFIAVINNQVLPLLKPTFGAAFTVQEGESLKATMGDPDSSPAEKMAQLDAFISQKVRDIETKESQLQPTAPQTQPATSQELNFDAQGNLIQ